jgi:hypothetical protein
MEQSEKKLADLIRGKNNGQTHVKDEKKGMLPILEVIVETHAELEAATDKYNVERRTLLYRYPGGKELIMRKYIPMRAPSVNQVERELGLDGALTELKKRIDKKYSFATGGAKTELPKSKEEPKRTLKTDDESKNEKPKLKLIK